MARGRKKRRMAHRTHVLLEKRDVQREREFLDSEVDLNHLGHYGDDAIVRALIYELPTANEARALEIALALQKRLRGEASLLENPDAGETISQLREQAEKADKAAEAFSKNSVKFVEEVIDRAPKLSEAEREKARQRGIKYYQDTLNKMKAGRHVSQLKLFDSLKDEPLETIHVTGRTVRRNGRLETLPDEIMVRGVRVTLRPGTREVPQTIAREYQKLQQQRAYLAAKKAVWSGKDSPEGLYEMRMLHRKLAEINRQFRVRDNYDVNLR